jgi:hypothetical protein
MLTLEVAEPFAHDVDGLTRLQQQGAQVGCVCARPRGHRGQGRYHSDGTSTNWCKIKNRGYTQMTARHELFDTQPSTRRSARVLAP